MYARKRMAWPDSKYLVTSPTPAPEPKVQATRPTPKAQPADMVEILKEGDEFNGAITVTGRSKRNPAYTFEADVHPEPRDDWCHGETACRFISRPSLGTRDALMSGRRRGAEPGPRRSGQTMRVGFRGRRYALLIDGVQGRATSPCEWSTGDTVGWRGNGLDALDAPQSGGSNGGAQRAPLARGCCITTHILRSAVRRRLPRSWP